MEEIPCGYANIFCSLNFHGLILTFSNGSFLLQLLLCCSNDDFLLPSFLLYLLKFSCKKSCLFPPFYLFIQSYIYFIYGYLSYSLSYNPILLFILLLKLFLLWPLGTFSSCLVCSLTYIHLFSLTLPYFLALQNVPWSSVVSQVQPGTQLLVFKVVACLMFKKIVSFPEWLPLYFHTSSVLVIQFLCIPAILGVVILFIFSLSGRFVVTSPEVFICISIMTNNNWYLTCLFSICILSSVKYLHVCVRIGVLGFFFTVEFWVLFSYSRYYSFVSFVACYTSPRL